MRIIKILSPVSGIISSIDEDTITIYIRPKDDYSFFAPIDGKLINIKYYKGSWKKNIFNAQVNKITRMEIIARIKILIKNEYLDKPLSFWIEVGKPVYITDIIRLNKKINDKLIQGEKMGEIWLESLVLLHFNGIKHHNIIKYFSRVIGGKTILSFIFKTSTQDGLLKIDHLMKNFNGEEIGKFLTIKQLIVITTPHEKCEDNNIGHTCDTFARILAEQLKISLANDSREIVYFKGNINRKKIDLNRLNSRDTIFRKSITSYIIEHINKLITQNEARLIYILDCHSFPPGNSFNNISINNPDIAILFDDCLQLIYVEELTDILNKNKIRSTKHIGNQNDIIDEFIEINKTYLQYYKIKIMPILIEINEGIDMNKLKIIGQSVNQWINNVNKYYETLIKRK